MFKQLKQLNVIKNLLLVLILVFLNLLISCGGGGGGGGGGSIITDPVIDPTTQTPSKINSLSLNFGNNFGDIKLSFQAPSVLASGVSVASYDIRYSNTVITQNSFSSCKKLTINIVPKSAGLIEEITINVSNLDQNFITRGGNIYFAIQSISSSGYLSDISNVASIKVPWKTEVKIYSKEDSNKFSVLSFGIMGNASKNLDNFDAKISPDYELSEFYSYFSIPTDKLIIDIHPHFEIDDKWTILVFGKPLEQIGFDFPLFNNNGPILESVTLIEKTIGSSSREFSIPDGVINQNFQLDGTGRGIFEIYIK